MTMSWAVNGRQTVGQSDLSGQTLTIDWTEDPELANFPWARPGFPCLLVHHVGVTLTTSAVAATRRVILTFQQRAANAVTTYHTQVTTTANLSRRYEWGVRYAMDSTAFPREPLPVGMVLLRGAFARVTIDAGQAGDSLESFRIVGTLLLPQTT